MIHISVLAGSIMASSSSSDSNWSLIGVAFFAAGFIFYGYIYARYRNADKRYRYEARTQSVKTDIQARDDYHRSLKGMRNSTMQGANNNAVHGSQNPVSGIMGAVSSGSVQEILKQAMRSRPDQ